jgi:hypothetical protein
MYIDCYNGKILIDIEHCRFCLWPVIRCTCMDPNNLITRVAIQVMNSYFPTESLN